MTAFCVWSVQINVVKNTIRELMDFTRAGVSHMMTLSSSNSVI
jgi:hypothetical protein